MSTMSASLVPSYNRVKKALWDEARERTLKSASAKRKNVVYWMYRDQRAHDNWALLRAQALAVERGGTMSVCFVLFKEGLSLRHYDFMLRGLEEVEAELLKHKVAFEVVRDAAGVVAEAQARDAGCVVCDFSPLRESRASRDAVARGLPVDVELREVDAHNVVPAWVASDKLEVGARTIRKKINDKLPRFLTEFPELQSQPATPPSDGARFDWRSALAEIKSSSEIPNVAPIDWCDPGERAAHAALDAFCTDGRLEIFADKRNDPNANAVSNLSPYFHFGQLSPQRAALRVNGCKGAGVKAFIEESVVRRELADNFCLYQPNYDSLDGAARWARDSLELHERDRREHAMSRRQFEDANSHEDLWNAAQRQLVRAGKMHGFMRMYWCKKILEWSPTPVDALATAIYLNDKYSIDGKDPNGYVGVAWSVMGTHDMGWKERPVFGKIRYMNYNGCVRKFDVKRYVAAWPANAGPIDIFFDAETRKKKKARRS
ncbi:hypothetical protein CTAYLR_000180 [Chrysophaeum taylorii]|uniref:Deoxyribodipyrimidine photo-lyase n=1 Tax=Chrysophaeum taylorii TaxID=2483200 RepID=A0AAD7UGK2_9STRA|nr:hypothetical protein CTAYLR_000180 [Chrysophaeum taylorii]